MSGINKLKTFFGFVEEDEIRGSVETQNFASPQQTPAPVMKSFKGTLIHSNTSNQIAIAEIKVEEPRIYEDSLNIATHLRENKPVIVNLKYLDAVNSKRLIDFVCGTAYAINGHMMKVGENIFLFTPAHVLIVDSAEKSTLQQGMEQDEKQVFFKRAAMQ